LLIPKKAKASRNITKKVHMLMQQYTTFL